MDNLQTIEQFWHAFERNAATLARARTADEPVYDQLLALLQQINAGLYFEFSAEPGDCELIITAEGDRSLFALVEAVVDAAPQSDGWTFYALKPKLGFPESVEWEGCKINTADVYFEPLSFGERDDLGLRLVVAGLNQADFEKAHQGLLRAIDHGLGEREFALAIQYTEVASLNGPPDAFIPLLSLEKFIEWRRGKRSSDTE